MTDRRHSHAPPLLAALASPLFILNVYDRVVPNNAIPTLWVLALGLLAAYTMDFVLRNLRGYYVLKPILKAKQTALRER